jgi:hypothetical protein
MNGHNGEVRGLFVKDVVYGMYRLACLEQGRYSKQHDEAAQRVHAITLDPWIKMEELKTSIVKDPWKIETLTGGAFKVSRRKRSYTVILPNASRRSPQTSDMYNDRACTCGYPLVNNMPCEHLIAVVTHRGYKLETVAPKWTSSDTHRRQLGVRSGESKFLLPSWDECVGDEPDLAVRVACGAGRKAGRPRHQKRHKRGSEGPRRRRKAVCTRCSKSNRECECDIVD